MDSNLSLKDHVKNIGKSTHFHLRNIGKIRKYLDKPSSKIIIHAFVSSKLDHCNSLLFGLPAYQIQKQQLIQNTAAQIFTLKGEFEHITPTLIGLHWLPENLVFKGLNGLAPSYITDLFKFKQSARSLRSSSMEYLEVMAINTKWYGDRDFAVSGPRLWNELPLELRKMDSIGSFRAGLKTHLFCNAYFN